MDLVILRIRKMVKSVNFSRHIFRLFDEVQTWTTLADSTNINSAVQPLTMLLAWQTPRTQSQSQVARLCILYAISSLLRQASVSHMA